MCGSEVIRVGGQWSRASKNEKSVKRGIWSMVDQVVGPDNEERDLHDDGNDYWFDEDGKEG